MSRLDKLYFGTNTKMYKGIAQTVEFLSSLRELTSDLPHDRFDLFVIPSYTTLERACQTVVGAPIAIGAQNMGWEDEGQFTGEISPLMLKEVGVTMVEIGHSERRHLLHETDEEENKKVLCALRHGLRPLLCIGETEPQKEAGIADETLRSQLKLGLRGVSPEGARQLMIAYEPVWAIGVSGKPATKEYAEARHAVIHKTLIELFGEADGGDVPVLYGGSVNPENAVGLIHQKHIDGLFIGRSAWQADRFNAIIREVLGKF